MLPVGAGTAFAEEDVFFFFFFLRVEVGEFAGCFLTCCSSSFLGFHWQLLRPTISHNYSLGAAADKESFDSTH